MKDFRDFEKYFSEHINESAYDTLDVLKSRDNSSLSLSDEDVAFVVLAARQATFAVLRQYDNWLKHTQT